MEKIMDIKNIYDAVIFTSAALTLREAVLEAIGKKTDLSSANLSYANLSYANLGSANLSYANLRYADLRSADLRYANLGSANLRYADLIYANLRYADLREVKNAALTLARVQFIPTEGAFIGWKKCRNGVIVKLGISASAKRSHGAERKCRCSKAKVLEVIGADKGISMHDGKTEYVKGKVVLPDGFDEDRWNVCGQGIHFYLTREEAEAHS
jgi:uncharacterized protein YjbI with pentapeptide repeats